MVSMPFSILSITRNSSTAVSKSLSLGPLGHHPWFHAFWLINQQMKMMSPTMPPTPTKMLDQLAENSTTVTVAGLIGLSKPEEELAGGG